MTAWDGREYQRRFDALADRGVDVHGEADFVMGFAPRSVLDAGCGTGRVAIELARRGVAVTGVDVDPSMLAAARDRAPEIEWIEHDLCTLDLGRDFDVVVLAGNVPLFTPPGTHAALIAACARHAAPAGHMIAGFQLGRGYELIEFDAQCGAAGLQLAERHATWDRAPFEDHSSYAVSVWRRAPVDQG